MSIATQVRGSEVSSERVEHRQGGGWGALAFVVCGVMGLLVIRGFFLDELEQLGWYFFWAAVRDGNINTKDMAEVVQTATFAKCSAGFLAGGVVGLILSAGLKRSHTNIPSNSATSSHAANEGPAVKTLAILTLLFVLGCLAFLIFPVIPKNWVSVRNGIMDIVDPMTAEKAKKTLGYDPRMDYSREPFSFENYQKAWVQSGHGLVGVLGEKEAPDVQRALEWGRRNRREYSARR